MKKLLLGVLLFAGCCGSTTNTHSSIDSAFAEDNTYGEYKGKVISSIIADGSMVTISFSDGTSVLFRSRRNNYLMVKKSK